MTLVHDLGGAAVQISVGVVNVVLLVLRVEDDGEGVSEAAAEALADLQDVLLSVLQGTELLAALFRVILFIWGVFQNALNKMSLISHFCING